MNMFDSSVSSKQFLRALKQLSTATEKSKPIALHNAVKRILERAEGFDGSKLDELISHISNPPKPTRARTSRSSQTSKIRPHSSELVKEIQSSLAKLENDESAFVALVQKYAKKCGAKTLKEAAANYAAAGLPKTKSDAVKLLKSERANRLRTAKKIQESGNARPW